MAAQHELRQHTPARSLGIRLFIGAAIGLVLVTLFLVPVFVKLGIQVLIPMATVSVGGAFGGLVYHSLDRLRTEGGWKRVIANLLSLLAYIFFLWFSSVPGFAAVGLWH